MNPASSHPFSRLTTVERHSNYFASKAHYESLARRIAAALSGGGRFVLVTGDPPADPQILSQALGNVGGPGYGVIDIPCGPELRDKEIERAVAPSLAGPKVNGGAAVAPESSATFSPLLLLIDFERLSDRQIEEVCEGTFEGDRLRASAVLLAPLDFAARLEQPALRFLKKRLAAHFCVQEVGDDEVIPFLHNQLLAQRDRLSEARGFRRGILIGLAASGIVAAAGSGAFVLLHQAAEQIREPLPSEESRSMSEQTPMRPPTERKATSAVPVQAAPETETMAASVPAPPPPSETTTMPPPEAENSSPIAAPAPAHPSPGPRLSEDEIAALVGRGDAFLSAGDVTSARLYYERAADAGNGQAAQQLGESFDPVMLGLAGLRGIIGDPAQAVLWYRRARQLGMAEADQRIERLETRPFGEGDARSRQSK